MMCIRRVYDAVCLCFSYMDVCVYGCGAWRLCVIDDRGCVPPP